MSDQTRPEHSEWGASGAYRWMTCPGSVALSRGRPNVSSIYAEEGTVAHSIGEACLLADHRNPVDFVGQTLKGKVLEIEVTDEMADAVTVYVNTVRTDRLLLGGKLMVEQAFDLSKIAQHLPGAPKLYGRNDAKLFVESDGHLILYDYKHGKGHAVDVAWIEQLPNGQTIQRYNPQLLYYALGAVLEHDRARVHRVKTIELVVVQPRAAHVDGPVRRVVVTLFELMEWAADLVEAVARTLAPAADLVPGDHCTFCPALAICPKQMERANAAAVTDFRAMVPAAPRRPDELSQDQIVRVLNWYEAHGEAWFRALYHHAHDLLNVGVRLPGWKLVNKRAVRRFVKSEQEIVGLCTGDFGIAMDELYTEPELKSVAQVEALLKRMDRLKDPLMKKLWEEHYESISTGTVLAPESDARKALPPPAIADFAHLKLGASCLD